MDRDKIRKLLDVALDIIKGGKGVDGYPYITIHITNYCRGLEIHVTDAGFDQAKPPDGAYHFMFGAEGEELDAKYTACMAHLSRLKKEAANGRQAENM